MIKYRIVWLLTGLLCLFGSVLKAQHKPGQLLKHVVIITFKEGAPANEINEVDDSFRGLAEKLKLVKGYEWGTKLPEGQTKAVTHVYAFSFASEKDLAAYGASPEHQQHIKIGTAIIERGQAVDYWVEP